MIVIRDKFKDPYRRSEAEIDLLFEKEPSEMTDAELEFMYDYGYKYYREEESEDNDMMVEFDSAIKPICHQDVRGIKGDVGQTTISGKTVDEILERTRIYDEHKQRRTAMKKGLWDEMESKKTEKFESMKLDLIRKQDEAISLFPESFPRPLLYSLLDAIMEDERLPDLKDEWLALHPNADAMHLMTFTVEAAKSVLARLTNYDGVSGVRFERIQGYRDTNMKSPSGNPDPQEYSRREVMKPDFKIDIRNDFVVVIYSFLYKGKRLKIGLATTSVYFNRYDGVSLMGISFGSTFMSSTARAESILIARITDYDINATHKLSISDYIKKCRENLKKVVDEKV